jgi:3'-phosphoadenosine 5'-phosphosulfate sulfotransferase
MYVWGDFEFRTVLDGYVWIGPVFSQVAASKNNVRNLEMESEVSGDVLWEIRIRRRLGPKLLAVHLGY